MKTTINSCICAFFVVCVFGASVNCQEENVSSQKHLCEKACPKDKIKTEQLTSNFCRRYCPSLNNHLAFIVQNESRKPKIQKVCRETCKQIGNSGKHTKEFCKEKCSSNKPVSYERS